MPKLKRYISFFFLNKESDYVTTIKDESPFIEDKAISIKGREWPILN